MHVDHVTINVTDLEASTRFYCDGLGCEAIEDQVYEEGEELATSTVEGEVRLLSRLLRTKSGMMLILNLTERPPEPPPPYRRQLGLTNIAVRVDDIDRALARLVGLGATRVERSRQQFTTDQGAVDVVVCLDPDGQPVELIADRGR